MMALPWHSTKDPEQISKMHVADQTPAERLSDSGKGSVFTQPGLHGILIVYIYMYNAMAVPWHCHGSAMPGSATAMALPCHGSAMAQCHGTDGFAMALPWQCLGTAMALPPWHCPWHCHGNAMAMPWLALPVPWHCHGPQLKELIS